MRSPTLPWKFAGLGLIVLFLIALPFVDTMVNESRHLALQRRSLLGLAPVSDLLTLLQNLQTQRGLTSLVLAAGVSSPDRPRLKAAIDDALGRLAEHTNALGDPDLSRAVLELTSRWNELQSDLADHRLASDASFDRHTFLVGLVASTLIRTAERSGLVRSLSRPQLYLEQLVLRDLPDHAEELGQLRALISRVTSGDRAPSLRARIVDQLAILRSVLVHESRDLALYEDASPDHGQALAAARDRALAGAAHARDRALSVLRSPDTPPDPLAFFTAMTSDIDPLFAWMEAGRIEFQRDLGAQVSQSSQRLLFFLVVFFTAFGVFVVALSLVLIADQGAREGQRWFRTLFEAAPDALLLVNTQACLTLANATARSVFGEPSLRAMESGIPTLVVPEIRESVLADLKALALSDPLWTRQWRCLRADGTTFPASTAGRRVKTASGDQMLVVVRDVSEVRDLEHRLNQSQKLEAVGQLAGGIAHDFNNLLSILMGSLELLTLSGTLDESGQARVETARKAVQRGGELTGRLLTLSRRSPVQRTDVRIDAALNAVAEMARRVLGPSIRVDVAARPDLPPVYVDPSELDNTLLNFAINARDAMPGGGVIEFAAQKRVLDASHGWGTNPLAPGSYIEIKVTDTGMGMPKDVLDRAFEPYFTTKPAGKGTGLGLSMAYAFALRFAGDLRIYSQPGLGTTVTLLLPTGRVPDEAMAGRTASPDAPVRVPKGAVALLVDDEPDILDVAERYLEGLGFRVFTASDAAAAFRVLSGLKRLDLLVSDVIMPGGITGFTLSRRVLDQFPGCGLVLTSGFPTFALEDQENQELLKALLNKPFPYRDFVAAVQKALDAPRYGADSEA